MQQEDLQKFMEERVALMNQMPQAEIDPTMQPLLDLLAK